MIFRQVKRRHASLAAIDDVADLSGRPAAKAAIVNQRRTTICSRGAFAMATLAVLRKQCFGGRGFLLRKAESSGQDGRDAERQERFILVLRQ